MTKKISFLLILSAAIIASGVCKAEPLSSPENSPGPWREYVPLWSNPGGDVVISQYDPVIRQVASDRGYDWRLISAIANAESRFDHDVVSYAGAVGLMQVMPSVAQGFKVPRDEMTDPLTNVKMGVGLLDQISGMLRFPRSISERDRLSIILAAYNCGPGRVLDARRLAVKYGENHNLWSVVSKYLRLLSDPAYFEDEVVRTGVFNGSGQTLGFVRKVLRYYDSYCEIVSM
jgi:membrane-bound lytic murein transglycosylase F